VGLVETFGFFFDFTAEEETFLDATYEEGTLAEVTYEEEIFPVAILIS
jgi:hypothetical protein